MTPAPREPREPVSRSEAIALGILVLVWLVMLLWTPGTTLRDDSYRFSQIATSSETPYRDVPVEYAPVETIVILVIGRSTPMGVAVRVAIINAFCTIACWWLLRRHWSREAATVYLWLSLPIQLFMPFRIDALTVLLILGAFVLADRSHERSSGLVAAGSVLLKVWPIVLVPAFLLRGQRRAAVWALLSMIAGGLIWIAISGASSIGQVAGARGASGWQAESAPGLIWQVIHPGDQLRLEDGALRVGSMLGWEVTLLRVAALCLIAAIWIRAPRSVDPRGGPALASVAVLLLLAPVLSPQYVAWLLPWASIMAAERASADVRIVTMSMSVLAALAFVVYWGSRSPTQLWAVSAAKLACIVGLAVIGSRHAVIDREVTRATAVA